MMNKIKILAGCAVLVLLDQLTKLWAVSALKVHGPVPLVKGVLELLYVENRGAAFGILQDRQWFFLLTGMVVMAALFYVLPRIPSERRFLWGRLCLYLVGAGAVGNMIDRFVRGYVVDFIYFKLIDFPVFNVADIYVTVATVCLGALLVFYYKDEDFEKIFPKRG